MQIQKIHFVLFMFKFNVFISKFDPSQARDMIWSNN